VNAGISPEELRQHMTRPERRWLAADGKLDSKTFRTQMSAMLTSRGNPHSPSRFFVDDDELIYFDGKTYAFNNQWGNQTLDVVDRIAAAHPQLRIQVTKSETQ
jgi:hypothetical protein